jgi:hypothetical protein
MKNVTRATKTNPLPPKHVAILFEGAWFFTQDPDDRNRILALCPYTNAPNHVCECGLWKPDHGDGHLAGLTGKGHPRLVDEGDQFWVDMLGEPRPKNKFTDLFEDAAQDYPIVYLINDPQAAPLVINNGNSLFRRVSIAMPDSVRAAGRVKTAQVKDLGKTSHLYMADGTTVVYPHVTFLFIYEHAKKVDVAVSSDTHVNVTLSTSRHKNPHLIFRVHSAVATDADGCALDDCAENCHMVGTFDTLRKIAMVPSGAGAKVLKAGTPAVPSHVPVSVFPDACAQEIDAGDTGLTLAELGLAPEEKRGSAGVFILTLASCASGGAGGDGGN